MYKIASECPFFVFSRCLSSLYSPRFLFYLVSYIGPQPACFLICCRRSPPFPFFTSNHYHHLFTYSITHPKLSQTGEQSSSGELLPTDAETSSFCWSWICGKKEKKKDFVNHGQTSITLLGGIGKRRKFSCKKLFECLVNFKVSCGVSGSILKKKLQIAVPYLTSFF